jgi:hypothetical protein
MFLQPRLQTLSMVQMATWHSKGRSSIQVLLETDTAILAVFVVFFHIGTWELPNGF